MTIEESLKHLQAAQLMLMGEDNQPISDLYYAMDTAIKSLESWESVKQEIKSNCIFVTYVVKDRTAEGIAEIIDDVLKQAKEQFLDIIDNYLEELEGQ